MTDPRQTQTGEMTVADIAAALGARLEGDGSVVIHGVAEPAEARADQIALAMKPEFAGQLGRGAARAALLSDGMDWQALGLSAAIYAPRPRYAMAGLSAMMDPGQGWDEGIHPSAIIHPTAEIGRGTSIGPLTVIGAGAKIGAGSVIGPQCFVGNDTQIGMMAFLREGVKIGARVRIGEDFIAQPGVVIGGDGFSFVTPEVSAVENVRDTLGDAQGAQAQQWARIHSLGSVYIGNSVELGANVCIDRGTVRDTRIGNGVKVDNLAQIGHNVEVGDDCLICAQVGIAGSSRIGRGVVLGGQTGISDNLVIGDNVITGGATKVLSNIPAGRVMLGYPAMKMETHVEAYKGLRRLPRLFRDVAALKKAVFNAGSSE